MTNLHRPEWPERRELVLATVKNVEFLGDAALDFLTAAWLYRHFP